MTKLTQAMVEAAATELFNCTLPPQSRQTIRALIDAAREQLLGQQAAAPGVEQMREGHELLQQLERDFGDVCDEGDMEAKDLIARVRAWLAVAPPPQPDERLPCDVKVAPATTFRKGVPIATMLGAIQRRKGRPDSDTTFPRPGGEAKDIFASQVVPPPVLGGDEGRVSWREMLHSDLGLNYLRYTAHEYTK